jgi:hypothetical protein
MLCYEGFWTFNLPSNQNQFTYFNFTQMILAEMRNYTNRKVIHAFNHPQGSSRDDQLFALRMLTANMEHMSMRIQSLTPQYATSTLTFNGRAKEVAQIMRQPMVKCFKKWNACEVTAPLMENQTALEMSAAARYRQAAWSVFFIFLHSPPPKKPVAVLQQAAQPAGRAGERGN